MSPPPTAPASSPSAEPSARVALAITSSGHALCHGAKVALPVVLSLAAYDLGVSIEALGLAVTLFSLGMAATSVPAGLLADRVGTARVLEASFWFTALGGALCATPLGHAGFVASHALLGAAAGFYHPAGLGLLSLSGSKAKLGPAFGWHGVAGSLGVVLAPLVTLALLGTFGWRGGFGALAVSAAAGGVATHLLRRSGRLFDDVPVPHAGDASVWGQRGLVLLLLAVVSNAFLLDGFSTMFPDTVRWLGEAADARADVLTKAAVVPEDTDRILGPPQRRGPGADYLMMAALLGLGAVGQYLGGRGAKRRRSRWIYVAALVAQPLCLGAAALSLDAGAVPLLALGGFAFANYMTQPMENHMLAGFTTRAKRGTAFALKFVVALALASPAPYLAARLATRSGLAEMYAIFAVAGVVGVAAGVALARQAR